MLSTAPNTLTHFVISSPARSSCTGHMNATCSNKHPTGSGWPHAVASHTSPTREAARKPPNSDPPLTGKTSCRREEAQLLRRGTAGERVHIPDWSDFVPIWDRVVQQRLRKQPARI